MLDHASICICCKHAHGRAASLADRNFSSNRTLRRGDIPRHEGEENQNSSGNITHEFSVFASLRLTFHQQHRRRTRIGSNLESDNRSGLPDIGHRAAGRTPVFRHRFSTAKPSDTHASQLRVLSQPDSL